jgi:hypothetical protein
MPFPEAKTPRNVPEVASNRYVESFVEPFKPETITCPLLAKIASETLINPPLPGANNVPDGVPLEPSNRSIVLPLST